jgi:hypothetical protein
MAKIKISLEDIDGLQEPLSSIDTSATEIDTDLVNEVQAVDSGVDNSDQVAEFPEEEQVELGAALESIVTLDKAEWSEDARALDTAEALKELADTLIEKKSTQISTESLSLMGKFAVAGSDMKSDAFICLESFKEKNKQAALEGVTDKIDAVINNLIEGIFKIIQTSIPVYRSFFTLFSFQATKAKEYIAKINNLDSSAEFNVDMSGRGFMAYGEDMSPVSSSDEYVKKATEATEIFSAVNNAAIVFTKSRFLSKTKATLSAMMFGAFKESLFFDMYSHLQNDLLQPLSKLQGLKVFQSQDGFKEYKSEVLLGGYQLMVKVSDHHVPTSKSGVSLDMKATIGSVPKNTAALDKVGGVFQNNPNVNLTFKKTQLLAIANQTLALAKECEKHISFNIKWNILYSEQINSIVRKATPVALPYTLISQMLATVRIVRLGSYLTHTLLGSTYAACKGLIANNFKILDQALKQAN